MEKLKLTQSRKPANRSGGKALAKPKHSASPKAGLDSNNRRTTAAVREPAAVTTNPAASDWQARIAMPAADDSRAGGETLATVRPTVTEDPPASETATQSAASDVSIFHMDSSLEIKDVENVHERLVATLVRGVAVTLDVGRLGAVDTAGVQLLVAYQSEAAKRGVPVKFCGESPPLTHALTVLGLGTVIRLEAAHD